MKHEINARLDQTKLEALYPVPDGFEARITARLDCMTAASQKPVKRRPAAIVLVFAALLILSTCVLALNQYGVLDFLFPGIEEGRRGTVQALTHPVQIEKTVDNMKLTIDSLFYDGESFALDWTLKNETPENPKFVKIEKFSINGKQYGSDGTDGFDCEWLPGQFGSNALEGGEYQLIPYDTFSNPDKLDIKLDINIYDVHKPFFYLPPDSLDGQTVEEQEAKWDAMQDTLKAKLDEGYLVMTLYEFILPDPENKEKLERFPFINGIERLFDKDVYDKDTMKLSFSVDTRSFRKTYKVLSPKAEYAHDAFALKYTKAVLTPAGLYLSAEITPKPGTPGNMIPEGLWQASDGKGKKFDTWPLDAHSGKRTENGPWYAEYALPLAGYKDPLPDEVSLTFYPTDGGTPIVSPVKMP